MTPVRNIRSRPASSVRSEHTILQEQLILWCAALEHPSLATAFQPSMAGPGSRSRRMASRAARSGVSGTPRHASRPLSMLMSEGLTTGCATELLATDRIASCQSEMKCALWSARECRRCLPKCTHPAKGRVPEWCRKLMQPAAHVCGVLCA